MFEKYISKRVQEIKPSGIRRFFDMATEMEGVISLGVGEPDFTTPWHICEAAIYSIETGKTHYTANQGLIELREEICNYQKERFHIHYNPQKNVIVSVGGSEGIDIAMRALINPGDEVILCQPSYVAYTPSVTLAGGSIKYIHLLEKDQFKCTPQLLKAAITQKSKVLILNFPNNPTGGVMEKSDYEKLVPIIKKHNLIVISDEIYGELTYEKAFCSLASFKEIKNQVILISGFSKAFAMTGWRLGYVCAHETFIQAMNKIHQYIIMSAPTAAQYAAIEALRHGANHVEEMRESYMARRNLITKGFNSLHLPTHLPQGAFYIFPNITSTHLTSNAFCEQLLQQQKVACVPGTAFGEAGEGYIRVSYACSMQQIQEALQRIQTFLKNLQK